MNSSVLDWLGLLLKRDLIIAFRRSSTYITPLVFFLIVITLIQHLHTSGVSQNIFQKLFEVDMFEFSHRIRSAGPKNFKYSQFAMGYITYIILDE